MWASTSSPPGIHPPLAVVLGLAGELVLREVDQVVDRGEQVLGTLDLVGLADLAGALDVQGRRAVLFVGSQKEMQAAPRLLSLNTSTPTNASTSGIGSSGFGLDRSKTRSNL